MPYGIGYRANVGRVSQKVTPSGANYIQQEGTIRRHEFETSNVVSLIGGLYHAQNLVRFSRTFGAGPDIPPTPTTSNNYAVNEVFNGSRIENFTAKFFIQMSNPAIANVSKFLDVYLMALSFWDALILDTVMTANSPVTFSQAVDREGEVAFKTPALAFLTPNTIKGHKFLQHYIKHLGTIELSHALSDDAQVVLDIPDVPAKCRRSQTGMFYGIMFLNDSQKNQGATLDVNIAADFSFMEIPSESRLPYIQ